MKMRNSILHLISNQEYGLTPEGAYVRFSSVEEARLISQFYFDDLIISAKNLKGALKIFGGDRKVYEIDGYMDTMTEEEKMSNELWFGSGTSYSPGLIRLALEICERPRSAGLVRLRDERQILIHDEASCTLKVATAQEATEWTRESYWHPQDLLDFRRRCRQESNLENTYRTFEPSLGMYNTEPGNWMEISTRYQLIEVEGESYQLFETLGYRDIEAPAF